MSRFLEGLSKQEKQDIVQEILDKKNKDNDKQWLDIVEDYDLECSSEVLRKLSAGVKFASDAGMVFDKSDSVVDRNFTERQKLVDLRRQIRQEMTSLSRTEMICERIEEAIKSLPEIKIQYKPSKKSGSPKRDLVLGTGDFHYGAKFQVTSVYGEIINSFDSDVFEERMGKLIDAVAEIVEKEKPDQLTLMIVGDMLDGLLRQTQLQRLQYGVIESTMRLSETMVQWIVALANAIKIPIRIYGVRGNHGEIRPLGSKAGQFQEENLERIVMFEIGKRFKDVEQVTVEVCDAPMTHIIDVCGYQFLLTHGQDQNIETMAKDCITLYGKPIDVFMVGHLHKSQSFISGIVPETNIYVERIPSICGVDPYAMSCGYSSQPGATAILMEEGYGRRCVYPIVLK